MKQKRSAAGDWTKTYGNRHFVETQSLSAAPQSRLRTGQLSRDIDTQLKSEHFAQNISMSINLHLLQQFILALGPHLWVIHSL